MLGLGWNILSNSFVCWQKASKMPLCRYTGRRGSGRDQYSVTWVGWWRASCLFFWEDDGSCTAQTQPGTCLCWFVPLAVMRRLSIEVRRLWVCVTSAQSRRCCWREMPHTPGLLLPCKTPLNSCVFTTNVGESPYHHIEEITKFFGLLFSKGQWKVTLR